MKGCVVVLGLVGLVGDARADAEHYEQVRVDAGMTGSSVAVSDRNGSASSRRSRSTRTTTSRSAAASRWP